jgi:G3E family GTPase
MVEITVFTGFLGSGKTSIILNLIPSIPNDYKIAILKNEFGDNAVDSKLFEQLSRRDSERRGTRAEHMAVKEMLNGCLCCVLVGQMKNALLEIEELYQPDRIIIETSGSAFPAPIAWQIRELEPKGFKLDSIITVVDCKNFKGYEDTSYTAKLQAQYSDLLLLNKVELVNERQLDLVIDHVAELNPDTPRVLCYKDKPLDFELIFGLDTTLFKINPLSERRKKDSCNEFCGGGENYDKSHQNNEVDIIQIEIQKSNISNLFTKDEWETLLKTLSPEDVYRVKGVVHFKEDPTKTQILNWAFGRWRWFDVDTPVDKFVELTVMGNYIERYVSLFSKVLYIEENSSDFVNYYPAHKNF